ncbi:MAG: exo-alpha-sialidase [Clostridia bacterium]|nr:exo-alpha-sialidase [Clostridia bacterium]
MKTRLFALLLAAVLSVSLFVGCNDNGDQTVTTTTTEATTTTTEESTASSEEDTTSTEGEEPTSSKKSTTTKKVTTTTSKKTYRTLPSTATTATAATSDSIDNVTEPTSTGSVTTTKKTVPPRVTTTTKDWSYLFPVKVEGTIEQRAAAVNNKLNGKQPVKIASEKATVTEYNKEWGFTHHPGLAYFKGKWYASFTQGIKDEDAPGQRCVVASSEDFFNWSEPVVVAECLENELKPGTLTANQCSPIYTCGDKLILNYSCTSYPPNKFDSQNRFQANADLSGTVSKSFVITSTDGVNWSEPSTYGGGGGLDTLRQTVTGRWFASHGVRGKYTDKAVPDGLSWNFKGLSTEQRNDATKRNNGAVHTESSWFQTKDHVLHIMVRSDTGYLWMMESYDNGETWTDLYPTNFGSSSTMWKFGELPDGRIFGIGTSGDQYTSRNKLELWISEDGVNFDTCYIIRDEVEPAQKGYGWAVGGRYAYPSVQIRDGYLHVLYSRHKEFMEVSRVKLSDIK